MKTLLISLTLLPLLAACQTLEERMAKRTGCDVDGVKVQRRVTAPGYQEFHVDCTKEKKSFKCFDAPFTQVCKDLSAAKPKKG